MKPLIVLMGTLLLAGSLFSQQTAFRLGETKAEIARLMGVPKATAAISPDYESWQFESEEMDEGEFSHCFVFGMKSGRVEGVTRNFPEIRNVDALFPVEDSTVIELAPGYKARARRMNDGAWLFAPGSVKAGESVKQIVLMKESVVRRFYPAVNFSASFTWRTGSN